MPFRFYPCFAAGLAYYIALKRAPEKAVLLKQLYEEEFLRASNQNVKVLLKNKTDEAFDKGIFGAPSFLINNKIFWGQDRLDFVIAEAKK